MNIDTCLAISSACVGVVSGWHFCRVNLTVTAEEIHAEAWPLYAYAAGAKAPMLIEQAANTFTGGVLLLATFALQVAEKMTPSLVLPQYVGEAVVVVALTVALLIGKKLARYRAVRLRAAVGAIEASRKAAS